jgi:hypothetical protein
MSYPRFSEIFPYLRSRPDCRGHGRLRVWVASMMDLAPPSLPFQRKHLHRRWTMTGWRTRRAVASGAIFPPRP